MDARQHALLTVIHPAIYVLLVTTSSIGSMGVACPLPAIGKSITIAQIQACSYALFVCVTCQQLYHSLRKATESV